MSLCSATARALGRSHLSPPRTLLPFLYQTATIQRRQPAARSIARRNVSSRSRTQDTVPFGVAEGDLHVPFEDADGNVPPTSGAAQSLRESTMTATEREAFEKLYKTFNAQGKRQSKGSDAEHDELDQIADEYYEDDEDSSGKSLDKVFETVFQGALWAQGAQHGRKGARIKAAGVSQAPDKAAAQETPQSKKKAAAKAEKDRVRKLRLDERLRVDKVLQGAHTDQQLWQTLEHEVFHPLRNLDLDAPASAKSPSSPKKKPPKPKPSPADSAAAAGDPHILLPNYPHHLTTAAKLLRTHFPSSPLPFTILATIKALGRSAYALGATTQLYRQLLRAAWLQQSSYALVDTLLTDMDTNMIEFDLGILDVLDAVIKEHDLARNGRLGRELQMVHGMEMWMDGAKKIRAWRHVVAQRLGVPEVKPQVVGRLRPGNVERETSRTRVRRGGERTAGNEASVRTAESDEVPFVVGGQSLDDGLFSHDEGVTQERSVVGGAPEEAYDEDVPNHNTEAPVKVLL